MDHSSCQFLFPIFYFTMESSFKSFCISYIFVHLLCRPNGMLKISLILIKLSRELEICLLYFYIPCVVMSNSL